ncbi:potassium channel family protein [Microvirga tunisiensis]|uniref:Two pore domain potassium channel family protein n=1 Tax=Microvirga tunisiensis TaxID=2108360 RepID=A0A5N7MHQ7_9HYPH|nr:potassium channel family protein [Microvirga tunisiensis]MPR09965.1 two pore domain potassium channel family protein [Microvirga tunisiensis]MPR26612.1 two pore domain potassium channel family protein [Microvirga tunisiensis]
MRVIDRLRLLYEGDTPEAHQFRYALLVFDVTTILFIVVTSFLPRSPAFEWMDVIIGLIVLADFSVRLAISRTPWRDLAYPTTLADIAAIVSFLAPVVGEGIGFLRFLRTLRLLRTYQLLARLRADSVFFRRNEDLIIAAVNLGVFIFIMTGFVYETQRWTNTKIGNYIDALYFTIAALTTTGFGDITLTGTLGHLISVMIMIFGVTLFLRLVQVLLRPDKVRFPCPVCALQRHDRDAVHCKACGTVLNIPDEGAI